MPPQPTMNSRATIRCYIKLVNEWEAPVDSRPSQRSPSRVPWNHSSASPATATGDIEPSRLESAARYGDAFSPIMERYATFQKQKIMSDPSSIEEQSYALQQHERSTNPTYGAAGQEATANGDRDTFLATQRLRFFPSYDPSWDLPFVLVDDIDLATDTVDRCAIKALAAARRRAAGGSGGGGGVTAALIPSYDIFLADKEGYVVGHLPGEAAQLAAQPLHIGSVSTEAYAAAAKDLQRCPDMPAAEAQRLIDGFTDWTPIPPATMAGQVLAQRNAVASLVVVPRPPYGLLLKRKALLAGNNSSTAGLVSTCPISEVYRCMNACVAMRAGIVERQHAKDERVRLASLAAIRSGNVTKVEEGRKAKELQAILRAHKVEDTRLMEQGLAKKAGVTRK